MQIATLQKIIKRRILINYRAEPRIIQKIMPEAFRPKLQNIRHEWHEAGSFELK